MFEQYRPVLVYIGKLAIVVSIRKHSGIYTLEAVQELNLSLEEAWQFFSTPMNLARMTPDRMGFKITSGDPGTMYPGQIISYKVAVFPGLKTNWVTEITHVEKHKMFVDEQRFGPYQMWHHEHIFEEVDGKVLMKDKVSYKLPLGFIGRMFHPLLVKGQLMQIFSYRRKILNELFK